MQYGGTVSERFVICAPVCNDVANAKCEVLVCCLEVEKEGGEVDICRVPM